VPKTLLPVPCGSFFCADVPKLAISPACGSVSLCCGSLCAVCVPPNAIMPACVGPSPRPTRWTQPNNLLCMVR
jgi:hypothetical protein